MRFKANFSCSQQTKVKNIIIAARPLTLAAAFSPVMLAAALAENVHLPTLLNILLSASLIQIISNFANDLYDAKKGADKTRTNRMVASGKIPPEIMQKILLVTIFLCILSAIPLVLHGGLPILLIGSSGILFAILYTATPLALAYHGLSEIFVLLYFGPLATAGTYFLLTNHFTLNSFLIGFIPGILSIAMLMVNNLRDYENDLKIKRKNLVSFFGIQKAKKIYFLLLFLPACIIISLVIFSKLNNNFLFALTYLLLIPFSVSALKANNYYKLFLLNVMVLAISGCLASIGITL